MIAFAVVQRSEIERLRDRVFELETQLGLHEDFPPQLFMGTFHGRTEMICGLLLKRELVTREAVLLAIYQGGSNMHGRDSDPKIVDVYVMQLRRQLEPLGISVETKWGVGWFMTREMKAKLRALVATLREAR